MKIAIIQDELVRKGGAEQVVLSFAKAFPQAPIYTLSYNPNTTYPEFNKSKIIVSWFGKLIKSDSNLKRFFFPFGIWAMKAIKLNEFDVVLLSTTHCAKYVKIDPKTIVLTYCHTPFRLVFRPESYQEVTKARGLKALLYKFVVRKLKKIDVKCAARTDYFITNAREVIPRIKEAYSPKRDITVINPPVKCDNFYVSVNPGNYYLVVSRFEPYKKIDLVIDAFNSMPERKLIIVGKGSMKNELASIAGSNIVFKEGLSILELRDMYANCKALIFPQHEDYGITPLEANASGRPVIAFGIGGVLDTMIPYTNDAAKSTAIFFNKQTVESLSNAIDKFERLKFDPQFIRAHAQNFDEAVFVSRIQAFVTRTFNKHFND